MTPSWRTGIGGPNAVTWPAFWVVLLASVLINLPDRFTLWNGATWWRNLLCNAIAVAAMFAVMWLLARVLLRGAKARPRPWTAIGIFVVGAIVRALAMAALLPTLGAGEPRPLFRLISSVLIMVPLLAFMAGLVDLIRTSAARRATLEAEGAKSLSAESDALARTAALQEGAIARVRGLLTERLEAMQAGGALGLGEDLRGDVEQVIRPLSHRLAADEGVQAAPAPDTDRARIAWGEIWRSATLGTPFRPVALAWVVTVASVNALVTITGSPLRGLGFAVALWVITYAVFTLLARTLAPAMRRLRAGLRTAIFVVAAIAGLVAIGLLLAWLTIATGGQFAWSVPIAVMTLGPVLALGLAVDQGYRRQAAATEADLATANARLQVSAALAGSVLWHEERRLARALHGPVQAAVTAAAMRIEAGDDAGAEALLVDAIGQLDLGDQDQRRVIEALAEVAAAWDGLCEVSTDIDPGVQGDLDAHAPVAASFVDICTEACSNAVRHGRAEHVVVQARRSGDALALVVSDDGAPTSAESSRGLGTALLDDVTLSWQRRREGDRTVLRATLPLARA